MSWLFGHFFVFWAHKNMFCHQKDFMLIFSWMPKFPTVTLRIDLSQTILWPMEFHGNDMKWFTMSLHGKPCITGGSLAGCTCINSRLLIAINWQNWVKLPPASLLWLLHRRTTQSLTATLHTAHCTLHTAHCTLYSTTAVVLNFSSA